MKKLILSALAAATIVAAHAQKVDDTVTIGASYANQVWYSLPGDEQGTAPMNEWDIAFDASGFGSTIMINSVAKTNLWKYPKGDITAWSTVDTNGLSTWAPHYNADTSWAYGAMGRYADPSNMFDLDWGLYDLTTHVVTGDSLYIIKLANGDYKKLAIESLSGSVYSFKYENLDGTDAHTATLDKSLYSTKNFGYYSIQNNKALDREPATANWDLVFTQYTAFIPVAYTVTGVLSNNGVSVAKCANVTGKDTFATYKSQTYSNYINTIGYDWKSFTGMTYKVQDSLVYFVARSNGEIWKMIFTGFTGSTAGSYMFSKERMYEPPTGVANTVKAVAGTALYPNPAAGGAVNLVYNLTEGANTCRMTMFDITGRTVMTAELEHTQGLHQQIIATSGLNKGMYIVSVATENGTSEQKLIVQ